MGEAAGGFGLEWGEFEGSAEPGFGFHQPFFGQVTLADRGCGFGVPGLHAGDFLAVDAGHGGVGGFEVFEAFFLATLDLQHVGDVDQRSPGVGVELDGLLVGSEGSGEVFAGASHESQRLVGCGVVRGQGHRLPGERFGPFERTLGGRLMQVAGGEGGAQRPVDLSRWLLRPTHDALHQGVGQARVGGRIVGMGSDQPFEKGDGRFVVFPRITKVEVVGPLDHRFRPGWSRRGRS